MTNEQKMIWAAVFGAKYAQGGVSMEEAAELAGIAVKSLAVGQDELSEWLGKDSSAAKYARTMGAGLAPWGGQVKG